MNKMIKIIANIIMSVGYSIISIITTIITGKLVKVSPYHFVKGEGEFYNLASDKHEKVKNISLVSERVIEHIIDNYIKELGGNENFENVVINVEFPIFDGNRVIGHRGYYPVLIETKCKLLNKKL